MKAAAAAEGASRQATKARQEAEDRLPPLREEEAVAAAILQRLQVQRDQLSDQESQARARIETLTSRIAQLARDIDRESGLNKDAGETIERLEWEQAQIAKASEGHDDALEASNADARDSAAILQEREGDLTQLTETSRGWPRATIRPSPVGRQPQNAGKKRRRGDAGAVCDGRCEGRRRQGGG